MNAQLEVELASDQELHNHLQTKQEPNKTTIHISRENTTLKAFRSLEWYRLVEVFPEEVACPVYMSVHVFVHHLHHYINLHNLR